MDTRRIFICFVLLPLSASQFCPDEYKCSSDTVTLTDTTSSFDKDTQMLDLSCKSITFLESTLFSDKYATNCTSVHLNDNCITFIDPEVFKPLLELRHLHLQNNQISYIHPSAFQSNVHLITLDLSGNKLKELNPIIFDKNRNLLWVNITGNPLKASAVHPTLFNLSLNTIDTDICSNTENPINYFQEIPYLRGLNLKEDAVFTVKNLTSYQNTKAEEDPRKNYVFHKLLTLGYNDSSELRYNRTQNVILGPSDISLMCFCNRLSAWFWCFEVSLLCPGHSADTYSLLNCYVTPTETSLFHTLSSSSAPTLSTAPSTEPGTTDDKTNLTTNTSNSNTYPEQETGGNNVILYVGIGVVVFVIIACIIAIVVKMRRKQEVSEHNVLYTAVEQNVFDPRSSPTYCEPFDIRTYNRESHFYDEPRLPTTFRSQAPNSAEANNIRRMHAENN